MIKVKVLKDDAELTIKVNKSFYVMSKHALWYLFQLKADDLVKREEDLKAIMEKPYPELDDYGKAFQTLTRLLGEIEKQATQNDLFESKEVLEPDDEGYVEPKQD